MKKILAISLAAILMFGAVFAFSSCGKKAEYKVGILQFIQHEALDAATQGFKDALEDILGKGKVEFVEQNASGEVSACATMANTLVSQNVDLIMANATPALLACYTATDKIPILGTSITEYGIALDIKDFNGIVGGNVSGTSDLADLEQQAQMIIDLIPNVKKVGLIYCSAEANSVYQVTEVKKYLEAKGITATLYPFSDSNDISAVTTKCADESDVIYIPTDNAAASAAETIGNIVRNKKVPVIAGEEGICKLCGVATLTIDYYELGYKTGEMAAKILKGEANISEMRIEQVTTTKKYNKEIADELGITIPSDYVEIG